MSELGTLLVRAREARGLTLEDAERDTRISRRYLQALESEEFEAIPAPVYARGFLRSYSQYLGLDPQEMLALFPRDEDQVPPPAAVGQPHGRTVRQPPSAVGPARPTWRGPQQQQQPPAQQRQSPTGRPQPQEREPERPLEPMIGVNIGVPAPVRRIKTDPAAQTRSLTIAIVALGAMIAVVLLALLISNLGGGSSAPGASSRDRTVTAGSGATAAIQPTQGALPTSSIPTQPGVVPNVTGQPADAARAAIVAAGFKVSERSEKSSKPKGTVTTQAPAPDVQYQEGLVVTIVISEGP